MALRPKPILPEAGEAFSGVLVVLTVAVTLFCLAVQFCLAGQPRVDFATHCAADRAPRSAHTRVLAPVEGHHPSYRGAPGRTAAECRAMIPARKRRLTGPAADGDSYKRNQVQLVRYTLTTKWNGTRLSLDQRTRARLQAIAGTGGSASASE